MHLCYQYYKTKKIFGSLYRFFIITPFSLELYSIYFGKGLKYNINSYKILFCYWEKSQMAFAIQHGYADSNLLHTLAIIFPILITFKVDNSTVFP